MPVYVFQHPQTEEIIEIVQKVGEPHVYVDEFDVIWERVFTVPQVSVDAKLDPYNSRGFVDKTSKGGSVGDLWDMAKEASAKRTEKEGRDPMTKQWFSDYAKKRNGKKHPQDPSGGSSLSS